MAPAWLDQRRADDLTTTSLVTDASGIVQEAQTHLIGYARPELQCDCTGVLLFVQAGDTPFVWPFKVEVQNGSSPLSLTGVGHTRFLSTTEAKTAASLAIKKALARSETVKAFRPLLGLTQPVGPSRPLAAVAYVDVYGYHIASSGWVFTGWIPLYPDAALRIIGAKATVQVNFAAGPATGAATICYFYRTDLSEAGVGFVLHVAAGRAVGKIASVDLVVEKDRFQCLVNDDTRQAPDQELARRMRPLVESAYASAQRSSLMGLLDRKGFFGEDTSGELADQVLIEIDEAIRCGDRGLLLLGWLVSRQDAIAALRLRSGAASALLDPERFVRIPRQDVVDALSARFDIPDNRCGFMAYVASVLVDDAPTYIEIETTRAAIAFKKLPVFRLQGLAAIRHVLERVSLQYDAVVPALNNVFGPAIQALNRDRLRTPPTVTITQFHMPPQAPALSVIVPLYGRIDFLEYQIALFSAHPSWRAVDLIYVLDDPRYHRELELLAESVASRFDIPFRTLSLDRNVGFGPANNVGLDHAHGEFVCYLNSDVFPGTPDALERLVARLDTDATLGAVGPLLLYEDGSVQHEGMAFKPIRMAGNMQFPLHTRKGRRPEARTDLVRVDSITGACMVLSRDLATRLGGFDVSYVIGDFEDADLCRKIQAKGLTCAVDHSVRLYHLERQSQAGPDQAWRHNLTLCNAWEFQRRWIWTDRHDG